MVRIDELARNFGNSAKVAATTVGSFAGRTFKAIVLITADVCKEVGGLRGVAGGISALVRLSGLLGFNVSRFETLAETCETGNSALGAIHFTGPISDIFSGKADSAEVGQNKRLWLASRYLFLAKDAITITKFTESLGLIAAGTAKTAFAKFSNFTGVNVTADGLSGALEYAGWGAELTRHIVDWSNDWKAAKAQGHNIWSTFTWKRGFDITFNLGKLGGIILKSRLGQLTQTLRFISLLAVTCVTFGRATHRYLSAPANAH